MLLELCAVYRIYVSLVCMKSRRCQLALLFVQSIFDGIALQWHAQILEIIAYWSENKIIVLAGSCFSTNMYVAGVLQIRHACSC